MIDLRKLISPTSVVCKDGTVKRMFGLRGHASDGGEVILKSDLWEKDIRRLGSFEDSSQGGEDIVVLTIMKELGLEMGTFLEVGAGNGMHFSTTYQSCTKRGWKGILIEIEESKFKECLQNMSLYPNVTCYLGRVSLEEGERIDHITYQYGIGELDFCSIDIDGYDYWVWADIAIPPKIICIEYNGSPAFKDHICTIPYELDYRYEHTSYFGATPEALVRLGSHRGYDLVAWTGPGLNLIFLRKDLNRGRFQIYQAEEVERFSCVMYPMTAHTSTPICFIENPCFCWHDQLVAFNSQGIPLGTLNTKIPKGMLS